MRWLFHRQRSVPVQDMLEHRSRVLSGAHEPRLKADFHIHTGDDPEDRVGYSSYELLDMAAEQGFDVITITNHDVITYHSELVDYARRLGILLIPGVEKTVSGKHVLIVNAEEEDLAVESFDDLFVRSSRMKLIIAPHPYYPSMFSLKNNLVSQIGLFSAIEYSHYYTHSVNFNRRAVELSSRRNLPLVGTSDAHFPYQLGTTYTLVSAQKTIESVIAAVHEGKASVVSDPLSFSQAVKISLSMSLI